MKEIKRYIFILIGSFILAFGIYNVHSVSMVTEGGAIGLSLLIEYWLGISPGISVFIINAISLFIGYKILGKRFILYSLICALMFALIYLVLEKFPRIYPDIYHYPLLSAIIGAVFVGVGVGICIKMGAAPTGDDALSMSFSKLFNVKIERIYMISDLSVLILSLSYIPFERILYSLVTVMISSIIIGIIDRNIPKLNFER